MSTRRTPAPTRVLTSFDRPQRLAFSPSYELPFGHGRQFLNSSNGVVKRLVGGWQVLANTVFQAGAPMGVPGSVWVLGDPQLENPTWDRLFKTGYIDATGVVRNVLPGEQPVFAVRPPNSLQTTPARWGNLRDRWATTYDASVIKNTRIREGHQQPVPIRGVQRAEHARVFLRPEPDADFDELRQDHSG